MKLKQKFFTALEPWAHAYRWLKWLAIVQIVVTLVLPIFWPTLDTGIWLLSFSVFAFWLSSYALLRLAHHHNPNAKGISGWFAHLWENALFMVWLAVILAIVLLVFKLVAFMWTA